MSIFRHFRAQQIDLFNLTQHKNASRFMCDTDEIDSNPKRFYTQLLYIKT